MSNTVPVSNTPGTPSADSSKLTPEAVIEQLRTMRSQIDEVAPLSKEQRAALKAHLRLQKTPIVDASINVMGVLDNVSQAIGHRSTRCARSRPMRFAGTPSSRRPRHSSRTSREATSFGASVSP